MNLNEETNREWAQSLVCVNHACVRTHKDRPTNGRSYVRVLKGATASLLAAFLPPVARETCTAQTKQHQRGRFGNRLQRLQLDVGDCALTL